MNDTYRRQIANEHVAFRVPSPVRERLMELADYEGISVSDICRQSVLQRIREHETNMTAHKPLAWSV